MLDELDDISARDIAMARYKRNHDYLSEIFTPYNAGKTRNVLYLNRRVLIRAV